LTLSMVEAFLEAGGENNKDFRFPLRSIKQKLDQALLDIGYKGKEAADLHMMSLDLMPTDVCNFAEDLYQVRYEKGTWPPAKSVQDAKRVPSGYGANIGEVATPLTQAQILLLIHQNTNGGGPGGGGRKGNCHGYGSSDHWLRDCPKCKNQGGRGNNCTDTGNNNGQKSWRSTPPKSGEPTTKKVNDKMFNWCAKCGRWTTTHTTAEHTGKPSNELVANLSEGLVLDPSAWHVSDTVDWHEMWTLVLPYLLCVGLGAYTLP
jgi:hypothetical protein